MNKTAITKLEDSIENFRTECLSRFSELDEQATVRDVNDLAQQTYYVFQEILDTLKKL